MASMLAKTASTSTYAELFEDDLDGVASALEAHRAAALSDLELDSGHITRRIVASPQSCVRESHT